MGFALSDCGPKALYIRKILHHRKTTTVEEIQGKRNSSQGKRNTHALANSRIVRKRLRHGWCSRLDGEIENVVDGKDDHRVDAVEHRGNVLSRLSVFSTHARDCEANMVCQTTRSRKTTLLQTLTILQRHGSLCAVDRVDRASVPQLRPRRERDFHPIIKQRSFVSYGLKRKNPFDVRDSPDELLGHDGQSVS